jgi:hypothetical protein
MSPVVLDALVGPHPIFGVGLNFGAVHSLKAACQNALGASVSEVEDGAQKYAAWSSSPEAGGSKRYQQKLTLGSTRCLQDSNGQAQGE